ncbi:MAG: hypothetical protein IID40_09745 [Planctomycetes bacterium]|nr:hypothetical protein [Planctomycetota bacterium]
MRRYGLQVCILAASALAAAWPARGGPLSGDDLAGDAPAEPPGESAGDAGAIDQLETLTSEFKKLGDWDDQHEFIDQAMEHMWTGNNWNSEADLFALETIRAVAKIPPWEFDRRIDELTDRTAQRYALGPGPRAQLKAMIYSESMGLMFGHASELFQPVRETVETRTRGEPFTPQQVARWTRQADPMMADFRERMARIAKTFGGLIDEQHRSTYEADLESLERRMALLERLREAWKQGRWRPEHWGLEHDPIQQRAAGGNEPAGAGLNGDQPKSASAGDQTPPQLYSDVDPSTWEAYVRDFIARYQLDPGQFKAAESILVELIARAQPYTAAVAAPPRSSPASAPTAEQASNRLRQMFAELQTRLLRIPTEAQRRRADRPGDRRQATSYETEVSD